MTFFAMLAFNIAAFTIPSITTAVSAAVGAVGVTTVAARQATALAAEKARSAAGRAALRSERIALGKVQRAATRRASIIYRQRKALRQTAARISARIASGAFRSVSTTVGKSIPIAGAAVVAGVTALELQDACDTMRNLAALEAEMDDMLKTDTELVSIGSRDDATDPRPAIKVPANATIVCGYSVLPLEEIWSRVIAQPDEIWQQMASWVPKLPKTTEIFERFAQVELPGWPDLDLLRTGDLMDTVRRWWNGAAEGAEPTRMEPSQ